MTKDLNEREKILFEIQETWIKTEESWIFEFQDIIY